jgi:quinoprotein glucose dehydrogenase
VKRTTAYFLGATALAALALTTSSYAQPVTPAASDWSAYGQDAGGARFSPLTQITPENVQNLKLAWRYHMDPAPAGKKGFKPFSTTTPIAVGNTLYLGTPYGRVVALDATTGQQKWVYELTNGDQPPYRGLAYWAGDATHGPRIIFGTLKGKLIALDAKTGAPAQGFGTDGVVETRTPDILNGISTAYYGYSSPPDIYKDIAIIGSRVQEDGARGASGDVRAWNVITGKLVWRFHTIPRPGEEYHNTWEGDGWKQRSGVNVWNQLTIDTKRGIAYLPIGAPTFDRYGGDHLGANLFSDSLVAVDAKTGKYLWHFQITHHDIWDYDVDTPPILITVHRDGKDIPAIAVMNKDAFLYILNRVTGEPLYQVNETPVPPSPVAGEVAWPTQPIPVTPPQLARGSFSMDELADITPEHTAACKALIKETGATGSKLFEPIPKDHPIIRFPGGEGGPEWAGGAFDPRLGYFVVNTNNSGYIEQLVERNGEWNKTTRVFMDKNLNPCQKPPWGLLTAVNVNTGHIAWQVPLGITDSFPAGKQNTGRVSNGGPIVTASGVTFIAGTNDQRFRAFDTRSGKELWTYHLDYSAHATPITYKGSDGRQYVAVVATGGSYLRSPMGGDSLRVLALPR